MHRDNNFDFLRFLFAIFVVITHFYALSGASETEELLHRLTGGQMVLSSLGLSGFFIISGFFYFQEF
tara:strand:+ start:56097 stop:56297 length:201 start_codon:yes stop_codon:yes gene_type:complete